MIRSGRNNLTQLLSKKKFCIMHVRVPKGLSDPVRVGALRFVFFTYAIVWRHPTNERE